MGRSSYAKRLTGQVSHSMPVLKPAISPFQKWSTPPVAPIPETEAEPAPASAHTTFAKAPEATTLNPISSQMIPQPAALSQSPERQVLVPTPIPPTISPRTIEAEPQQQRVSQNIIHQTVIAEPSSSKAAKTEAPGIDLPIPGFRSIDPRSERGEKQQQTITHNRAISPEMTQPRTAAVSFLHTRSPQEPTGDTPTRRRSPEQIDVLPRSEPREKSRTTLENPAKNTIELQPRKEPADSVPPATPMRLEPRIAERPVLPAVHRPVQEPQTQTAGRVHIGTVEVRITPPSAPVPPIVRPVQARPSPAPVLSRSFTSPLGLTQGQ